jgi:NAD-dependent DNA ligase
MDIEGLGFSLAEALVNSGMVKTPADLCATHQDKLQLPLGAHQADQLRPPCRLQDESNVSHLLLPPQILG